MSANAPLSPIDLVMARTPDEEGTRVIPYDDATGKNVRAPVGNLSWGRGFNLAQVGSPELFDVIERYLFGKIHESLMQFAWYKDLDAVRQSVLLDIAYNAGTNGLLHFPLMLHYLSLKDFANAALECTVRNPELKERYLKLAEILATGEIHS